jgi:hypothetical protein
VAYLFALSALLVHLAMPTVQATPASQALRPADPSGSLVAYVKPGHGVALLARPNGRRLGVLGARTFFGSPQVLPVVRSRAGWLGVISATLPNRRLGWIDAERLARVRPHCGHTRGRPLAPAAPGLGWQAGRPQGPDRDRSRGQSDADRSLLDHRQAGWARLRTRLRLLHPRALRSPDSPAAWLDR